MRQELDEIVEHVGVGERRVKSLYSFGAFSCWVAGVVPSPDRMYPMPMEYFAHDQRPNALVSFADVNSAPVTTQGPTEVSVHKNYI